MIDKKWKQQNEGAYWAMQPGECEEDREARLRHYYNEDRSGWPYHPPKAGGILTKNEWLSVKLDGIVSAYLEIQDRANIITNIVDDIRNECPDIKDSGNEVLVFTGAFVSKIKAVLGQDADTIRLISDKATQLLGED